MADPGVDRVVHSLAEVPPAPSVVTIGFFDGVHRGHRAIIDRAVDAATDAGCRSVVVTFDRHPMEVVEPGSQPAYLQRLDQRVDSLLERDVDLVVVLAFTAELAGHSPAAFVEEVLAGRLRARRVVVGDNFRFGHRASGDAEELARLGAEHDFAVEAVPLLRTGGETISSTMIRERLRAGDVSAAAAALGRPHVVEGPVVRGEGRGGEVGVPTANVDVPEGLLVPRRGVYAGTARVRGGRRVHQCVVNIGVRPTFGGGASVVEAHLLDAEPDLYGRYLAVAFVARLRDERAFDDVDALVAQIHRDIGAARSRLTEAATAGLPHPEP